MGEKCTIMQILYLKKHVRVWPNWSTRSVAVYISTTRLLDNPQNSTVTVCVTPVLQNDVCHFLLTYLFCSLRGRWWILIRCDKWAYAGWKRTNLWLLNCRIVRKCPGATDFSRRRMLTIVRRQLPAAAILTWLRIPRAAVSFSTTTKSRLLQTKQWS